MKLTELGDKLKDGGIADSEDARDFEVKAMIMVLEDQYGYKRAYQLSDFSDMIFPI